LEGILDLARVWSAALHALSLIHTARQEDEHRLSTPVTGVASERDDEPRRWR
jgi:hypothetical protein